MPDLDQIHSFYHNKNNMPSEHQDFSTQLKILFANYKVHFRKLIHFRWNLQNQKNKAFTQRLSQYSQEVERSIDEVVDLLEIYNTMPLVDMSSCMRWAEIKRYEAKVNLNKASNEIISDNMSIKDLLLQLRTKALKKNDFEAYKVLDQLYTATEQRIADLQALFLKTVQGS